MPPKLKLLPLLLLLLLLLFGFKEVDWCCCCVCDCCWSLKKAELPIENLSNGFLATWTLLLLLWVWIWLLESTSLSCWFIANLLLFKELVLLLCELRRKWSWSQLLDIILLLPAPFDCCVCADDDDDTFEVLVFGVAVVVLLLTWMANDSVWTSLVKTGATWAWARFDASNK